MCAKFCCKKRIFFAYVHSCYEQNPIAADMGVPKGALDPSFLPGSFLDQVPTNFSRTLSPLGDPFPRGARPRHITGGRKKANSALAKTIPVPHKPTDKEISYRENDLRFVHNVVFLRRTIFTVGGVFARSVVSSRRRVHREIN